MRKYLLAIVVLLALTTYASGQGIQFGGGSAAARARPCEVVVGDPGASSPVLADDNDTPAVCTNTTGATFTITAVKCRANTGTPSINPIITGGSSTSILSSALSCGNGSFTTGTLSGTPTQTNGQTIDVNIVTAGGAARVITVLIERTLP